MKSLLAVAILLSTGTSLFGQDKMADTLYLGGKVYTVNESQPWAEAFAIKDDKFLAVGSTEEIEKLRGEKTVVVDLRGNLVLPGLIDDHCHPDMASENYFNIGIDEESTSYEEFKLLIRDYRRKNPDAKWIFGGNLDYLWDDGSNIKMFGMPSNKAIIDDVVSDVPAYFWEVSGHAALVNAKALEVCGITKDTPDPVGGHYVKDENGELTGVLRETAAHVVWEQYLKNRLPTREIAYKRVKPVLSYMNSLGLTSFSDVWTREWFLKSYNILDREDQLTLRVVSYMTDPADWVSDWMKDLALKPINDPQAYTTPKVKMLGVKFVLDGAAAGRTARMVEPYEGEDEFRGPWRTPPEEFKRKFAEYDKRGLVVRAHAAGSGSIRLVLDAIEESRGRGSDLRHVVAHTALPHPTDIPRFVKLNAIAEFSPVFWYDMAATRVIADDIGPRRLNQMYPLRSMIDTGSKVSIGTDWTVTPIDPWRAIETAVTRRAPGATSGPALNGDERITVEEAIYLYTMGGAYAQYRENEIGSIEADKFADFVVVDQNIFEVPLHEIHKTKVLSTVLGGQDVYLSTKVQELIDLGEIDGQFGGCRSCARGALVPTDQNDK